ncbi:MAG TPA: metallophosphoesterase, partial [Candidatus Binatia bacterium]|nr:metallophosphoesterase [Candidatus Binatia bacterium]
LLDCVMVAQLLTARSGRDTAFLYAAGISWVGAIWFSAHALLFLGYAFIGFARLSRRVLSWALRYKRNRSEVLSPAPVPPERRQFLRQLGVLGAGAPFFLSLSGVKLSYDFRVEEREIVLPHWPRALDGLRVAHLSDIHVGSGMNRARLLRVAALTNAARPDLIVHTGDFLTHRSGNFDAPLYEALARLKAPYGQWACLGNHDLDAPERLVRGLSQAGVTTLRNSLVTLSVNGQPLEIAGLDYLFVPLGAGHRHYADVIRSWGPRRPVPRLLLNHAPQSFSALPHGCADLVLSGHTHGGHVGIQLGRDHALTVVGLCGMPDQGLFRRGDMRLFVTRCVGFYGYPMRLGIPPEIALLTLRAPVNS